MTTARQVASNTAVQIAGSVVSTVVAAGSVVLMTRYLGPNDYGKYNLAWVILSFFSAFADLGLLTLSVREMATHPESTENILGNVLTFRLVVSVGILACACGVTLLLPYSSEVRLAVVVLALAVLLALVNSAFVAVLRARLVMQYSVVANTIGSLAGLGALAIVVILRLGFYGVLATASFSALITLAVTAGFVRRMVRVRFRFDTATWRRFWRATALLGTVLGVNQIYYRADTLLLSFYRSYTEVGLYTLAGKLTTILLTLSGFFVVSIFPVLASLVATDDPKVRRVIQTAFDALTATSLPLGVGGAILAPQIIGLAAGARFAGAVLPLRVLFGALAFTFVSSLMGYALVAKNEVGALLKLTLGSLAINVLLNLVVIPRFGAVGAAATTAASEAMVFGCAYGLMRRYFGFAPTLGNTCKAALAAIAMGVCVYIARNVTLVVVVPAGAGIYLAALAMLGGLDRRVVSDLRRAQPTDADNERT